MTDNLRQAAEMALEALQEYTDVVATAHDADNWHQVIDGGKPAREAIQALRQALDQLPDTTKMIDKDFALNVALEALHNFADDESVDGWKAIDAIGVVRKALAEPDMGIDRGAWADVPDATKWVDELRGGEDLDEPPQPIGEVQVEQMERPFNAGKVVVHFYDEPPPVGTKLYTAPPKPDLLNQTCCGCGRSGGYALYCGECWNKASQWQGLTDEEIHQVHQSVEYNRFMSPYRYAHEVIKETEAKLKEKNGGQ